MREQKGGGNRREKNENNHNFVLNRFNLTFAIERETLQMQNSLLVILRSNRIRSM